jgi:hypothetical protein
MIGHYAIVFHVVNHIIRVVLVGTHGITAQQVQVTKNEKITVIVSPEV